MQPLTRRVLALGQRSQLTRPSTSLLQRRRPTRPGNWDINPAASTGIVSAPSRSIMSQSQSQPEGNINSATNDDHHKPITPESLSSTLREKLGATHADIIDMSGGCGQAFEAVIVSPEFNKKNTLARHRLVNAALKDEIAAIHAWSPKCFSPEEWARRQA